MSDLVLLLVTGLGLGALYFLAASGLSLIYGLMGVLNFAHGAFMMAGAYAGWLTMGALPASPARCGAARRRGRSSRVVVGAAHRARRRGRAHPAALPPPHPAGPRHRRPLAGGRCCGTGHLGRRPPAGREAGRGWRARPMLLGARLPNDRFCLHRRRRSPLFARAAGTAALHPPRPGHPGRRREPHHGRGARHRRAAHVHDRLRHRRRRRRPGRTALLAVRRDASHPARAARC